MKLFLTFFVSALPTIVLSAQRAMAPAIMAKHFEKSETTRSPLHQERLNLQEAIVSVLGVHVDLSCPLVCLLNLCDLRLYRTLGGNCQKIS